MTRKAANVVKTRAYSCHKEGLRSDAVFTHEPFQPFLKKIIFVKKLLFQHNSILLLFLEINNGNSFGHELLVSNYKELCTFYSLNYLEVWEITLNIWNSFFESLALIGCLSAAGITIKCYYDHTMQSSHDQNCRELKKNYSLFYLGLMLNCNVKLYQ